MSAEHRPYKLHTVLSNEEKMVGILGRLQSVLRVHYYLPKCRTYIARHEVSSDASSQMQVSSLTEPKTGPTG